MPNFKDFSLIFRFVRVEMHSPSLFIRCNPKIEESKSSKEEEYPCRNSSLITDYDKIKDIEICLWQEFEFFVSSSFRF